MRIASRGSRQRASTVFQRRKAQASPPPTAPHACSPACWLPHTCHMGTWPPGPLLLAPAGPAASPSLPSALPSVMAATDLMGPAQVSMDLIAASMARRATALSFCCGPEEWQRGAECNHN